MTALADYRTLIRANIGDASGDRFTNDEIDQAIRYARDRYSDASPYSVFVEFTVAATGRNQVLTTLAAVNLKHILQVFYPYTTGDTDPVELSGWYHYNSAGTPALFVSEVLPEAGQKFYIHYARSHNIDDLDSASATTIPDSHNHIISDGAAYFACQVRSAVTAEAYSAKDDSWKVWLDLARGFKLVFEIGLRSLRAGSAHSAGPLPSSTWKVDSWDQ